MKDKIGTIVLRNKDFEIIDNDNLDINIMSRINNIIENISSRKRKIENIEEDIFTTNDDIYKYEVKLNKNIDWFSYIHIYQNEIGGM